LVDVEAPHFGRPARFHDQPGKDIDQRRLARAIGAEQPEYLSARYVETDLVERALGLAALRRVSLAQLVNADRRLGRAGHSIRIAAHWRTRKPMRQISNSP